jgi:hypothetical protein
MQISARVFRGFVWVAVVVSLAANFVDSFGGFKAPLLDPTASPGPVADGNAFRVAYAIYGVVDVAASIVSTVGLLLLKKWARPLTVLSIFLQGSFYLLNSYYIESAGKHSLVMLANILTGVVTAMAYTSTVAQRFR